MSDDPRVEAGAAAMWTFYAASQYTDYGGDMLAWEELSERARATWRARFAAGLAAAQAADPIQTSDDPRVPTLMQFMETWAWHGAPDDKEPTRRNLAETLLAAADAVDPVRLYPEDDLILQAIAYERDEARAEVARLRALLDPENEGAVEIAAQAVHVERCSDDCLDESSPSDHDFAHAVLAALRLAAGAADG